MGVVNTLVITGYGTNSHLETAHAARLAGADRADVVHFSDIVAARVQLHDYHFLVFPGGFLDGDDLGAAQAASMRWRYLKDDKGVPVFAMCINQNISRQMAAIAALEDQIRTAPAEDSRNDGTQETFAATSEETMEAIVRKVLQQFGKLPTELDREERIALIAQFDQHGAFRFKGMVEHIASIMGISKYTLYSYRKACRQGPANGPQDPELPS